MIEQSATLFNFLGSLQQRAPPQPVLVDSLVREQAADEEWAAVRALPDVILSQMDGIRELAEQLPEDPAQVPRSPPQGRAMRSRQMGPEMGGAAAVAKLGWLQGRVKMRFKKCSSMVGRDHARERLQTREEPEDVDAIVALISENHALDAQLADELERAEARLHSGLALTDALGKHELRVRDLTPPER